LACPGRFRGTAGRFLAGFRAGGMATGPGV
jgi:hypothetical protein